MATIEILSWKEDPMGFTAWDNHARAELKKRLCSGIKASPHEIKRILKRIIKREIFELQNVKDEGVNGITQMLLTMGAEYSVELADGVNHRLFQNIPKRQ
jgi:hypothetical protein